jgi:hypothetical protein
MVDRFDLEEKIMRASWVLEDIRLFRDRLWQRETITPDEIDNFLMAMETIYQHRFDDLEDMMCQVFELNQYRKKDPKINIQPRSTKELDEFYNEVETNRKFKPDLMSTFDEKM